MSVPNNKNKKARRAKYTAEIKEIVRQKYPYCFTLEEKWELARELGMNDLHKLYNLASRLQVTRSYEDEMINTMGGDQSPQKTIAETVFSQQDDEYLQSHFGSMSLDQIASQRGHDPIALAYRARHLGLRKPIGFWSLDIVAGALCWDMGMLEELQDAGLDIWPIWTLEGECHHHVISSTSLAKYLKQQWQDLIVHGANEFFIHEILESYVDMLSDQTQWELCKYLDSGHICNNPQAVNSYGLFCTNTDKHAAGCDPHCDARRKPLTRSWGEMPMQGQGQSITGQSKSQ